MQYLTTRITCKVTALRDWYNFKSTFTNRLYRRLTRICKYLNSNRNRNWVDRAVIKDICADDRVDCAYPRFYVVVYLKDLTPPHTGIPTDSWVKAFYTFRGRSKLESTKSAFSAEVELIQSSTNEFVYIEPITSNDLRECYGWLYKLFGKQYEADRRYVK